MNKKTKDGTTIPGTDEQHTEKLDKARQATLDPKLTDPDKTPGSGMFDDNGHAPSG